jgi:ribonucleoside-diphosphate reductase alpha chain/ribonucleoside-triphosphate reductase
MKVSKRDGRLVEFNLEKIVRAIENAMKATKDGVDHLLSQKIAELIGQAASDSRIPMQVEEVQDWVENYLMDSPRKDVAKAYILYRYERDKTRDARKRTDDRILTDEFVSRYKHLPAPMKQLGNFVYYRTYSRWLQDQNRREYWWETVRRAVEYNAGLVPTTKAEAERLFDNIFHLRQFLSGRTFWVGGTPVAQNYPISNYNCAFEVIDGFDAFKDLFYLLMVGAGVGVRILKDDVNQLPKVRTDYELIHQDYSPVAKTDREDSTSLHFSRNASVKITVGDSKEGWTQALDYYIKVLYSNEYRDITTIVINYDHVRPKGEKLKTFGGTASGHESLKNMFFKIDRVMKKLGVIHSAKRVKLKPIDCLDISNIIGENVVVGGVRRTAEIVLVDSDDKECIDAKSNLYKQIDGQWIVDKEIIHRQMSNNSIYYREKPSREQWHWQIEKMRYSGEPGFVNAVAAEKRRPNFKGVNPCGEILLDTRGLCNLTTINTFAYVQADGTLDREGLLDAQRLSAKAGYRMTCVELELPMWDSTQNRDKLVGCSLTGWQDMVNAVGMTVDDQAMLLGELKVAANEAAEHYAEELGENAPILVTTVKPEGTLSQLPTVSSGVHYSHSPYYIRRVRINATDPLAKVAEELDWPVFPEVGQEWKTCSTKVVEFPVQAPEGRTKYDVSALEQLQNYKLFMDAYVEHNCSITVHVREHEWDLVEEWVYDHWGEVVALSFLSLDDNFYDLLPYESIEKDEYERRVEEMRPFIPNLISKYEKHEQQLDIGSDGCDTGVCPIR